MTHDRPVHRRLRLPLLLLAGLLVAAWPAEARRFPNVVVITVDTLRADHLSSYGYHRQTSPNIDQLLRAGVRYTEARTVEPLTNPALSSMITSRYPHEHGATRNGLPMRRDLPSFAKQLGQRGFTTAAFVGNWTLKDQISGLGEHFDEYHEVFTRKRWLIIKGEATAGDITERAIDWLTDQTEANPDTPLLLWVHYVEPHAPYRNQRTVLDQLGLPRRADDLPPIDRYDSEIAFVDRSIGRLIDATDALVPPEDTLFVFSSDHGESLGEHRYWGHGRNLFEPGLRVPLGFRWSKRLTPATVDSPATLLDIGPTILGLIGYPATFEYQGLDWSAYLDAPEEHQPSVDSRTTYLQAHKGAVQGVEDRPRARERGLLQVGLIQDGVKQILSLRRHVWQFDLEADPREAQRQERGLEPSEELLGWQQWVRDGLAGADSLPVPELDPEDEEQMRSLGYLQ